MDRTKWNEASVLLDVAYKALNEAAKELPIWTGVCECGRDDDLEVQEEGYTRGWQAQVMDDEPKAIHAFYGGSGDWGDEGRGVTVIVCTAFNKDENGRVTYCGLVYQPDPDLEDAIEYD